MESYEEEYQCSGCGNVVPPDAEVCPNCGASLEDEDTFTEDEFVEIPLSYDPAYLSAFLSLLDENNIDYTIDGNALQNLWGNNLIQTQRLLVRNDQYKTVKEIMTSFENDEISIVEEKELNNETGDEIEMVSESKDSIKERALKGIEGLLLTLSLILILGPIAFVPLSINNFFEIQEVLQRYPLIYNAIILDILVGVYISILSINAGIKIYKIKPDAIEKANGFFNILILYQIISFLVIWIILTVSKISFERGSIEIFGELFLETVAGVGYAIAAKLYLKNSERVKNTFNNQ